MRGMSYGDLLAIREQAIVAQAALDFYRGEITEITNVLEESTGLDERTRRELEQQLYEAREQVEYYENLLR